MNYWDGKQWSPSQATFEVKEDGFFANKVQQRTRLSAELNVLGAVTTWLSDGTPLQSTPLAIALYDPTAGRMAVVSTLTNSTGVLVACNRVAYPRAFRGSICADVIYTLKKGSFEQDVVITSFLNPLEHGFPADCQILTISEFYGTPRPEKLRRPIYVEPNPAVRSRKVSPDRIDEVIGFGEFVLATGQAFTAPTKENPRGHAALVSKELQKLLDGRIFLVETVEYKSIKKGLEALPPCETQQASIRKDKTTGLAAIPKPGPASTAKAAPRRATPELAYLADSKRGVRIDYRLQVGGTINDTKVFQGDTTWLVVDAVYCNGPVVIEGGSIFKFSRLEGCGTSLNIGNSLTLKTSNYSPAILTAMDDDSIGDSAAGYNDLLTGYTGNIDQGGYANPALLFDQHTAVSLQHLRFMHAVEAVRFSCEAFWPTFTVAHSQFVDCWYGITVMGYSGGCSSYYCGLTLQVQNALFSATAYPCVNAWPVGISADLKHCTIDGAAAVVFQDSGAQTSLAAYNSIFSGTPQFGSASGVGCSGSNNGFHNSFGNQTFGTDPVVESEWPFAPVGYLDGSDPWYFVVNAQGGHYLRNGSPFRGAATPNIPPGLKDELSRCTTVVPELFNYDINSSQTLGPTPIADAAASHLGYHYPVLHYVVCGATVNNCTLNIDQGTVLAFTTPYYEPGLGRGNAARYWNPYLLPYYEWGIRVNPGGRLNINGVPTNRVVLARLEAVQEQPTFAPRQEFLEWCPLITFKGIFAPSTQVPVGPLAEARIRYTDFPTLAGFPAHIADLYPDYTYDLVQKLELDGCHLHCGRLVYECAGVPGRTFTLRNNVFERTSLVFGDVWSNGVEEEVAEVRNNLFYWSPVMALWPATGANWVFTDNIFDHVSFPPGFNGPVGENHENAYVAMTGGHLSPATETGSNPDLASLTYQTGSLGGFYLPATATALLGAGSRSASAAGLWHFASLVNNTKQGAAAHVNIGPAYLALVNGIPADSNTGGPDGVPDFLADRNGNGVEESDEMNWTTANTRPLTILSPIQSTSVGGVLKLRVDLGTLGTGAPQPYALFAKVDGTLVHRATHVVTPAESLAEVEFDTYHLANGEHSISVIAYIQTESPGQNGAAGQEFAVSPEIVVNVMNDISFPAWEDFSQVAMKVNVETPHFNQDYAVWFYSSDYATSYDPSPVSSHLDSSSGTISFMETLANLGYGDGTTHPSLYSVTELPAQGVARINPVTRNDPTYPQVGRWVVTYELDPVDATYNYNDSTRKYELVSNILDPWDDFDARWMHDGQLGGWIACGVLSGAPDSPLIAYPQPGASTPQTWPIRTRHAEGFDDIMLFRKFIGRSDVRNLYALAHGGSAQYSLLPLNIQENDVCHRYRFAFFDGCETAAPYVMKVFGASSAELYLPTNPNQRTLGFLSDLGFPGNTGPIQIEYYVDYLRPSAFLGWQVSPSIALLLDPSVFYHKTRPQTDPWTGLPCDYQIYCALANWHRQVVFFWTLNNKTIVEALRDATDLAYVPGTGSGDLQVFSHIYTGPMVRIGPDKPEYYFDGPRQNLAVYGHGGLKFNAWNHAADAVPTSQ